MDAVPDIQAVVILRVYPSHLVWAKRGCRAMMFVLTNSTKSDSGVKLKPGESATDNGLKVLIFGRSICQFA